MPPSDPVPPAPAGGVTLLFVDTETTGLHPADGHRPWEVAMISVELDGWPPTVYDIERAHAHWMLLPLDHETIDAADDKALDIGRFDDRWLRADATPWLQAVNEIVGLTDGVVVVGAEPRFDMDMIEAFLGDHGIDAPAWDRRPVDVRAFAAGYQAAFGRSLATPHRLLGLADTAAALGVPFHDLELHTALGDAILAMRVWWRASQPVWQDVWPGLLTVGPVVPAPQASEAVGVDIVDDLHGHDLELAAGSALVFRDHDHGGALIMTWRVPEGADPVALRLPDDLTASGWELVRVEVSSPQMLTALVRQRQQEEPSGASW